MCSDRGTENTKIAFMQPFLRRHGTDSLSGEKSFRYGRSVHNQVQECSILLYSHNWYNIMHYNIIENRALVGEFTSVVHPILDRLFQGIIIIISCS